MTFTIYRASDDKHIILGTRHTDAEEFFRSYMPKNILVFPKWQSWNRMVFLEIPVKSLYDDLADIASFVNNEFGEEFMLEVD